MMSSRYSLRKDKKMHEKLEQGFLWKQQVRMDAIRQCHHHRMRLMY